MQIWNTRNAYEISVGKIFRSETQVGAVEEGGNAGFGSDTRVRHERGKIQKFLTEWPESCDTASLLAAQQERT